MPIGFFSRGCSTVRMRPTQPFGSFYDFEQDSCIFVNVHSMVVRGHWGKLLEAARSSHCFLAVGKQLQGLSDSKIFSREANC